MELVNLGATALNEEYQYNHEQHAGNYPNNRYVVHVKPPFFLVRKNCAKRLRHDNRLGAENHYEE